MCNANLANTIGLESKIKFFFCSWLSFLEFYYPLSYLLIVLTKWIIIIIIIEDLTCIYWSFDFTFCIMPSNFLRKPAEANIITFEKLLLKLSRHWHFVHRWRSCTCSYSKRKGNFDPPLFLIIYIVTFAWGWGCSLTYHLFYQLYFLSRFFIPSSTTLMQVEKAKEYYNTLTFHLACECILDIATAANVYVDERKPWELFKKGEEEARLAAIVIYLLPFPVIIIHHSLSRFYSIFLLPFPWTCFVRIWLLWWKHCA